MKYYRVSLVNAKTAEVYESKVIGSDAENPLMDILAKAQFKIPDGVHYSDANIDFKFIEEK
jgi:hypothetical protein